MEENLFRFSNVQIIERKEKVMKLPEIDYIPRIRNATPRIDPKKFNFKGERFYKVIKIINEDTIRLNTGLIVKFLGVKIDKKEEAILYLKKYISGKDVFLKFQNSKVIGENTVMAYVYLKNKIFINTYLIKSGLASPDLSINHKFKDKFIQLWKEKQ